MNTPTLSSPFAVRTALFLSIATVSGATLAQAAAPAVAAATAPTPALTAAYNLGVVSDYRYRGLSQTINAPALQGGVDATFNGALDGLYLGAWASNVRWVKDAGGKGNMELDLYGGYKWAVSKGVTLDFGVLSYQYPRNNLTPSANTNELYLGASTGPFSAKYSRSVSNLFGFASSKGSSYLELNLEQEVAKGTALIGHIGKQTVINNKTASYMDVKIGVTYEALGGKFAASVIGANEKFYSISGKNTSKPSLVIGYTKTF